MIVEDDAETREGLTALLQWSDGFVCAGAHSETAAALRALPVEKPDVILLDLELGGASGEDLIRQVKARAARVEILVLTIHDTPERIFSALDAGASGYLVKVPTAERLLEAIAEVHAGGSVMSSQVARLVIERFRQARRQSAELDTLTEREAEVLNLLAHGGRYQEIARQLGVSVRTVSTHLHNIYRKLHVHSATEAAARKLGS